MAEESVIDFGCGAGYYSTIVPGEYVGVDLNQRYITFAEKKYNQSNRNFLCHNITCTEFSSKQFDKSMYLCVMHHLSDDDNHKALKELQRITQKRCVIVDLWPSENKLRRFIQDNDPGGYLREIENQETLILPYFQIIKRNKFYTNSKLAELSLFIVTPK